jgi:ABC-type sugar transport system ATPase subunit
MSTITIRAHAIARRFGDEQAVAGVDLEIRAGEIVALVGLNGAGKSTLMRLLLGMLRPDGGTAEVLGSPVVDADRAVWSRVGHLIETPPRYGELTVAESIYSAARLQGWIGGQRASPRLRSSPMSNWAIGSIARLALCRWAIGNVSGLLWLWFIGPMCWFWMNPPTASTRSGW